MKKISLAFCLFTLTVFLSSCSAIAGIFKAGFWAGFIFVVVIIAVLIFLLANIFKKK